MPSTAIGEDHQSTQTLPLSREPDRSGSGIAIPPEKPDDLPAFIAAIALLSIALAAPAWGNFPLNDDWQHAHLAKQLAETGRLHINTQTAPALVGQILLGAGLIRLFGFHHGLLRGFTIAIAILLCWILNRILRMADVKRSIRIFCLLLFICNPIAAHLALSFMTEFYGYTLAFGGVLIWFLGRASADRRGDARLISVSAAVLAAALIGGSFWIRQFCVAAFPALLIACALEARSDRRRISASLAAGAWSTVVLSLIVGAYFWWVRASGNMTPQFSSPMAKMTTFQPAVAGVILLCAISYATFFMLPSLAALSWRGVAKRPRMAMGLGYIGAMTAAVCAFLGQPDNVLDATLHNTFPYLRNVIYNAGVGPLTTPDLRLQHVGKFGHWDVRVWIALEILLVLGHLLWAAVPSLSQLDTRRREMVVFSSAFAVLSLALVMQAFQDAVFDRYLFPTLLGGVISMACLMSHARLAWRRGALVLGSFALFTVGGVHDYFAFNQARWQLVDAAQARGVSPADINGGWEVDGWFRWEHPEARPQLPVIGQCAETFCLNDAFVIGTIVPEDYGVEDTRRVKYWLANGPDLVLSRRNDVLVIVSSH